MPSETYTYTGSQQSRTLPPGVEVLTIECWGAGSDAPGGYATGQLLDEGGSTLYLYVGGSPSGQSGGWPNGGNGGSYDANGTVATANGGAGATGVRLNGTGDADRIIVAGGGGANGAIAHTESDSVANNGDTGAGGQGGGQAGGDASVLSASASGGGGGTGSTESGGGGSATGHVNFSPDYESAAAGGGGGGGYQGGGGGGADVVADDSRSDYAGAGGGGGSSYTGGVTSASTTTGGGKAGDGEVALAWTLNAPSSLTILETGDTYVTVSWSGVTNAHEYEVYYSTSSGVTSSDTLGATTSEGTTTATVTGLSTDTTYYFAVRATDGESYSGFSNEVSTTTTLAAPASLAVTAHSATTIDLSWNSVSNADGYRVYRATSSGGGVLSNYTPIADITTTSYGDTGLNTGEQYYYVVTAYNTSSESPGSNEVDQVTDLPAPTGLSSPSQGDTTIGLSWSVNHNYGSQRVEYKLTTDSAWTTATSGLSLATSTYTITGLLNGEVYDIRVFAVTEHTETVDT